MDLKVSFHKMEANVISSEIIFTQHDADGSSAHSLHVTGVYLKEKEKELEEKLEENCRCWITATSTSKHGLFAYIIPANNTQLLLRNLRNMDTWDDAEQVLTHMDNAVKQIDHQFVFDGTNIIEFRKTPMMQVHAEFFKQLALSIPLVGDNLMCDDIIITQKKIDNNDIRLKCASKINSRKWQPTLRVAATRDEFQKSSEIQPFETAIRTTNDIVTICLLNSIPIKIEFECADGVDLKMAREILHANHISKKDVSMDFISAKVDYIRKNY